MASVIKLLEGLHPFVADSGSLKELMNVLGQQLDGLVNNLESSEEQTKIDTATGYSIDLIGAIFDMGRLIDESDESYRSRLLTAIDDIEMQSSEAISNIVKEITGFTPQIDEYPDVDFVDEYGTSTNSAVMRVLVPFNKWELHSSEIKAQIDRIKAAGVYVISESFDRYFEEFFEYIYLADSLSAISVQTVIQDSYAPTFFQIGISRLGIDTRIGGQATIEHRPSEWDVGHWDEAWYDGEMYTLVIKDGY